MDNLVKDFRYALRMLRRNPGFTALVVFTLALGIGANSAIFSIVNAVLLRPLPFHDPERVVFVWETLQREGIDQGVASIPNFFDWKEQSRSFEDMGAAFYLPETGFNLTMGGEPERVSGGMASAGFFAVLGVKPAVGRLFNPEEDRPGGAPVALISHGLWQRRFGSSPEFIGRTIGVDAVPRTLVGVLPPAFDAVGKIDLWVPRILSRSEPRGDHNVGVIARLRLGVSLQQAQSEMETIARRLEQQYPDTNKGWGVKVVPMAQVYSGPIAPALLVLEVAVGFLLLITCANVAGVLLARASARQKEIAIRVALGADRWRVVRQLLTESVVLALAGGLLGLLLAGWGIGSLRSQLPDYIPRLTSMDIDLRVTVFTIGVSLATGLLFGVVPAFKASRGELAETLKEGGGKNAPGSGSQKTRSLLLVGEVALSLVLSIGAGLLTKSFIRLAGVNPGFQADNLLTMTLALPGEKYPEEHQRLAFYRTLLEKVKELPGVKSAAAVSILPLRSNFLNMRVNVGPFQIEGLPPAQPGHEPSADFRIVTRDFFESMSIPLVSGRSFSEQDTRDKPLVILVNETMARRYFSGQDPIGKRLSTLPATSAPREIVGVVKDVRLQALGSQVQPGIFLPHSQEPWPRMNLVVRTLTDPVALSTAIRQEVLAIDKEQPVANVQTMRQVISDSVMPQRLSMALLSAFAMLALVLAIVGIYGLTAYSVSQRTREIGIRMALGAQPANVLQMVIRKGVFITLLGIGIGIVGALAVTRGLSGLLYGVTTSDPVVFAGIAILLTIASVLACFLPARKAVRVDPMEALRYE
ncbi:MAG TPA: ABC transporter permease [Terriglobia bacterium]|nr:ABC transporter permease [Terriglobia bacterium]